jgi:hypothetical protein
MGAVCDIALKGAWVSNVFKTISTSLWYNKEHALSYVMLARDDIDDVEW